MNKVVFSVLILLTLVGCGSNDPAQMGTNMNHEFLPVEKAFQFSSQQVDATTVKLSWNIAEGYHLYKNKLEFKLEPETARIADVQLPKGVMLDDKTFGRQESYKGRLDIAIKLKAAEADKNVKLITKYQGCSEKGLCYPPEKREVNLTL